MPSRDRPAVVVPVLLLLAAVLATVLSSPQPDARLHVLDGGGYGAATERGQMFVSFGLGDVCIAGGVGEVEIVDVQARSARGGRVSDFAVVPVDLDAARDAAHRGRLGEHRDFRGVSTVGARCAHRAGALGSSTPRIEMLVVEIERDSASSSVHVEGLDIVYRSGGREHTVTASRTRLGVCDLDCARDGASGTVGA